jgi:tripartite-type tricarboxylate transporter receptor subunit TctC
MRQLLASRLRAFRRIAAAMMIALYPAWTFAADWPQRPVTVVVPFAAGGNTDTVARILCQRLTEKLGQPFVIDNRGGASGAIAAANVASAAPDGYTLLLGSTPQIAIVPFIQKVSYDPRKDLIPTSIFAIGTFVLAVSAAVPADTMADFIAYAKARPGKLVYGSGGNATISRLGGALFAARAGLQLVHVPYRGGGPAVMDFLANRFDMYFGSALEFVQYRDDKRIRLLGISSEQASPQFPGLPPIADVLPGFKLSTWNGLMAPAATPRAIVDVLVRETIDAATDPVVAGRLRQLNIEPRGSSQEEFAATFRDEQPTFDAAIKAAQLNDEKP